MQLILPKSTQLLELAEDWVVRYIAKDLYRCPFYTLLYKEYGLDPYASNKGHPFDMDRDILIPRGTKFGLKIRNDMAYFSIIGKYNKKNRFMGGSFRLPFEQIPLVEFKIVEKK